MNSRLYDACIVQQIAAPSESTVHPKQRFLKDRDHFVVEFGQFLKADCFFISLGSGYLETLTGIFYIVLGDREVRRNVMAEVQKRLQIIAGPHGAELYISCQYAPWIREIILDRFFQFAYHVSKNSKVTDQWKVHKRSSNNCSVVFLATTPACFLSGQNYCADQRCNRTNCSHPFWSFSVQRKRHEDVKRSSEADQRQGRQKHCADKSKHLLFHIAPHKYCEKLNTTQRGVSL